MEIRRREERGTRERGRDVNDMENKRENEEEITRRVARMLCALYLHFLSS